MSVYHIVGYYVDTGGGTAAEKHVAIRPMTTDEMQGRVNAYGDAWRRLSRHLRDHWGAIIDRGSFDLSKPFAREAGASAVKVQLHFVNLLGGRLLADKVPMDLASFSEAVAGGTPHPDVTLLIADGTVPHGRLRAYGSDVSLLRDGEQVLSALWLHLEHPVAVKICYIKGGAAVREPEGFPWHPTRQRKIVKISPYKGDAQPLVPRRDLRIGEPTR